MKQGINYEDLFYRALCVLLEQNGGSLSEALGYIRADEQEEKVIREEMAWDEDKEDEE